MGHRKKIDIVTLGCSKNLVDSEQLMFQLEKVGYEVSHDSPHPDGNIAVINTCGFIADAKEESINTILEFAQAKEEGILEHLYVMGCLSERYLKDLQIEIPQVDKYYGKFNWKELLEDLGNLTANELYSPDGAGAHTAEQILAGIEKLTLQCENLILVSNEVFSGGADYLGDTDRYLRVLAAVNNAAAARADAVVRVVCGIPVYYKGSETQ